MAMTFYEWRRQPGNEDRTLTEYEAYLERLARTAARANRPPAAEDALVTAWESASEAARDRPTAMMAMLLKEAGDALADAVRSTVTPLSGQEEFRAINGGHGRSSDVVRLTANGPEIVLRGLWDWQAKALVAVLSPPWKD